MNTPGDETFRLPAMLRVFAWWVAPFAWLLAGVVARDTLQTGQMVGFAVLHTSPIAIPLVLSAWLAPLWVLVAFIALLYAAHRRERIARESWVYLGAVAAPLVVLALLSAIRG